MTSNDLIILEAINGLEGKVINLQAEIKEMKQEIKDTRNELMTEIRINQNDTVHIQTSVYWGFAIIGVIIAFVGLYPFRHEKFEHSEDLSPRNIRDIRALIREEFSMLNSTRAN